MTTRKPHGKTVSQSEDRVVGAEVLDSAQRQVDPLGELLVEEATHEGLTNLQLVDMHATRHLVLLRGVNIGSRNRVAMPALRTALEDGGFDNVGTYLQSGNVVLSSSAKASEVAQKTRQIIAKEFGLDIAVVTRTRAQLANVVERNPLGRVAKNPKRYQVSFLDAKPSRDVVRRIEEAAAAKERVVVDGREVYAWHPDTIARSKLWTLLAGQSLGVTATARNWTTVTKLLELADS